MLRFLLFCVLALLAMSVMALLYRTVKKEIDSFLNSPLSIALSLFAFGMLLVLVGLLFSDAGQGDYPYLAVTIAGAGGILALVTGAHVVVLTFKYLTRNRHN